MQYVCFRLSAAMHTYISSLSFQAEESSQIIGDLQQQLAAAQDDLATQRTMADDIIGELNRQMQVQWIDGWQHVPTNAASECCSSQQLHSTVFAQDSANKKAGRLLILEKLHRDPAAKLKAAVAMSRDSRRSWRIRGLSSRRRQPPMRGSWTQCSGSTLCSRKRWLL